MRQKRRLGDRFRVVAYKNCSFAAQPEERGLIQRTLGTAVYSILCRGQEAMSDKEQPSSFMLGTAKVTVNFVVINNTPQRFQN